MGYSHYVLADGREAGYAVDAVCDESGCTTAIDRGLAYLCGRNPGGDEHGCGDYFCSEHLYLLIEAPPEVPSMCRRCCERYDSGRDE